MRAVLDANVLISAFVYPRGRVAPVWRASLSQRYILVTSPEIVTELAEVLRRTFGP
jgi:predicted nucleic acid-binding protein